MHCLCWLDLKDDDLCGELGLVALLMRSQLSNPLQANAGDSRSVLGVKGRAKPLSYDHKPQNEGES